MRHPNAITINFTNEIQQHRIHTASASTASFDSGTDAGGDTLVNVGTRVIIGGCAGPRTGGAAPMTRATFSGMEMDFGLDGTLVASDAGGFVLGGRFSSNDLLALS